MLPRSKLRCKFVCLLVASAWLLAAQTLSIPLDNLDRLDLHGVKATVGDYRGLKAVALTGVSSAQGETVALVKNITMQDGTIEVDLAGAPSSGAMEGARGFVGIAFRAGDDARQFEYFYLRPTNGRAEDQVRRNHSAQYASHPDYPWQRLRKEEPEKYETYVDLEPGVWTKVRIVVSGKQAKLYVQGATQPTLDVNDLKLPPKAGGVGLWIGPGTEAHFANLKISKAN